MASDEKHPSSGLFHRKLPGKRTNIPWQSIVTSPFLRGHSFLFGDPKNGCISPKNPGTCPCPFSNHPQRIESHLFLLVQNWTSSHWCLPGEFPVRLLLVGFWLSFGGEIHNSKNAALAPEFSPIGACLNSELAIPPTKRPSQVNWTVLSLFLFVNLPPNPGGI